MKKLIIGILIILPAIFISSQSSSNNENFDIAKDNNIKLLRIQNSPSLKKKELDYIIKTIKKVSKNYID